MHQRYKSTRGGKTQKKYYSFEEALFSGYAPDGGLFVPVSLPVFNGENQKGEHQYLLWSKMTFPELAYDVLVRIFYVFFSCIYYERVDSKFSDPLVTCQISNDMHHTAEIHFTYRN